MHASFLIAFLLKIFIHSAAMALLIRWRKHGRPGAGSSGQLSPEWQNSLYMFVSPANWWDLPVFPLRSMQQPGVDEAAGAAGHGARRPWNLGRKPLKTRSSRDRSLAPSTDKASYRASDRSLAIGINSEPKE